MVHDFKFEGFYYDYDHQFHYLSEIQNISNFEYETKYRNHIFCPECYKAKLLIYHIDDKIFLKSYPLSVHGEVDGHECYHSQDEAPQYVVKEYLANLKKNNKLQSKLDSLIRIIERREVKSFFGNNSLKEDAFTVKYKSKKSGVSKKAAIPRYSINQWYYLPEDTLFGVYGKVHIEVAYNQDKNNPNKKYTNWLLKNINTGKFITSINASYYPEQISDGDYIFASFCMKKKVKNFYPMYLYDMKIGMTVKPLNTQDF